MEAIVTVGMRLPRRPEAATMPRVSTIQPTDEDLLARVAEGDRDAFGDLYRRYARAVLGLALRRIADRGRAHIEPPAEPLDMPSNSPGPPERAEQAWVSWRVHRALEELPETERSVLELAYWSELSQSEIADFLGIPLGTVKTRTRSGLRRLADLLGEEDLS